MLLQEGHWTNWEFDREESTKKAILEHAFIQIFYDTNGYIYSVAW